MQWLIAHSSLVVAISYGVVSEALAIVQLLKYPDNSGVGGVLSALLKILISLGAPPKNP